MAETQFLVRRRALAGLAAQGALCALLGANAACAPTVQSALPNNTPIAPHFDIANHIFVSFDGARLGLSAWLPLADQQPWAVIVGLHGMNDYGEAFSYAGPWFAARGVAVYAYDARGFGRSPDRGVWAGEQLMVEDARTALAIARSMYPNATLAAVGDSMGSAALMVAFGGAAPPPADRLILTAPAVWGWSSMPDIYALVLWSGAHVLPGRRLSPPRDLDIMPSDNIPMLRALSRDPLMIGRTRIDAIYGLVDLMEDASKSAAALKPPTAFLYGDRDQIIPRKAAMKAARRLPPTARTALYPNGYHMLLRDLHAETVYQDMLTFLRDPAAPFPSAAAALTTQSKEWENQAIR